MKTLLQTTLIASFIASLLLTQAAMARTVEVDVHGMTCAFCVDNLERKFKQMETVKKVEVSLKLKKIRLETEANLPTEATIKQAVLDTGFTPVNVRVLAK